jgi:hypothetical protein
MIVSSEPIVFYSHWIVFSSIWNEHLMKFDENSSKADLADLAAS